MNRGFQPRGILVVEGPSPVARARLHRPMRSVDQSIQREDLHRRLVLVGASGPRHGDQSATLVCQGDVLASAAPVRPTETARLRHAWNLLNNSGGVESTRPIDADQIRRVLLATRR